MESKMNPRNLNLESDVARLTRQLRVAVAERDTIRSNAGLAQQKVNKLRKELKDAKWHEKNDII